MLSVRSTLGLALLLALTGAVAPPLQAQISVKATPYSFRANLVEDVPSYALSPERLQQPVLPVYQKDEAGFFIIPPAPPGIEHDVDLGFDNAGRWTALPDGGRLWRLRIASEGAASLHLIYDDFWMPPGARLFLYNDDRSVVLGAFTQQNNKAHGGFATDFVPGQATTLEYYEPAGVVEPGRLHVSTLMHGTQGAPGAAKGQGTMDYTPTSLSCSINVACSEGNGWENEINATVKISNGCTGVLVNNTREDETPYVLTAYHCGQPSVGQTLNWVFQFNYQSDTCADPAETPTYDSVSGAVVRAAQGGDADFVLLELLEPIPASYGVHYAGWSIEGITPSSGTVIGHPAQDIKKITIDDDALTTSGTQWQAWFDHGTIESGSSGSPLFNENHQVVGLVRSMIFGSFFVCNGPGGDDNNAIIRFPKLSLNWNLGNAGERISDFLDPDGTGSSSMPPLPGSGGGIPADIWINEVNADASASQDDEFIEVVGPPGTSLGNYTLEIYSCSGGSATLQSTQTVNNITLQNDYEDFGVCVIGGPGIDSGIRDQVFSGSGTNMLPDGYGLIVLKDASGTELFDYQYDTESGGSPDHCPPSRTTRSPGDPSGDGTMGFIVTNPLASDPGFDGLTATPGVQNFDGGQQLPVELVSFDAMLDGHTVLLRWKTASETNNAGFEIQGISRSDQTEWEVLGFIEGAGTTVDPQRYSYRVDQLLAGQHRFRLKQVDFDGTFEYSPEVEVAVGLPTAFHLSKAYPNPFNPETQFSVSVAQAQQVETAVYDVVGRRVATLFDGFMDAQTTRSMVFEAGGLPSGLYLIRIVGERFVTTQVVTLVK